MSSVVKTIVETDLFDVSTKTDNNTQAQEQEVKDCTEFLKIEYERYKRNKILLEGIEECIEDDIYLEEDLRNKIKSIILGKRVSQITLSDIPVGEVFETVLGAPLTNIELSFSESSKLLSCLKNLLDNKCFKLNNECFELLGNNISEVEGRRGESPLELAQEDTELFQFRSKLAIEQDHYVKHLLEFLELLEELKNIRLKTVPEVTDKKVQECSLKSKINFLKSQLAREKCRVDVFIETSSSLKAYTEIIKDIKEQQGTLKLEIERLKILKEKYVQVSCKEYDDILKSYLQYKYSFEKKKMMYELYG